MKTYRSKIDWWLILLILGIFGYPIMEGILTNQYGLSITMISILIIMFWMFSKIKYVIEGTMLKVWWVKIDIHSIKRIYKTNNPLSSPALSLDRIAIVYNKYDEVLISPKLKKEFVDELLKINPSIIVEI
ncbi:MAG: PH domain-containing protein [Flavobacteriales bacterium]|nr:PH domain-containing protein [Flavobacteriales bacterium]